jgi:transcriptional regulator with XRE-family HTH domain
VEETRGRRRPPDAKLVIAQVKEVFGKKKEGPGGVKNAAKELGISPQSFYNYINGKTLPDIAVLRKASEIWKVKWKYMDLSEVLNVRNLTRAEQLSLPLYSIQAKDVEVVAIGPKKSNVLQVTLNIRFSA